MLFDICGDWRIIVFKRYFVEIEHMRLFEIITKLPFDDPYLIATEVTNPDYQTSALTEVYDILFINFQHLFHHLQLLTPPLNSLYYINAQI